LIKKWNVIIACLIIVFITFSNFPGVNDTPLDTSGNGTGAVPAATADNYLTGKNLVENPDTIQQPYSSTRAGPSDVKIGGVWAEDFGNDEWIAEASNVFLPGSGVRLEDAEVLMFADNFSGDTIDDSRWYIEEGSGTILTTSGQLIAIKNNWVQSAETYLETHRSWQVSRRLEFEWNSILEDGLNGYKHEVDIYRTTTGERIWISFEGDRRVILKSTSGEQVVGPPFSIQENKWFKVICKLTPDAAHLQIRDKYDHVLNYQNMSHGFVDKGSIRFGFADVMSQKGYFEVRVDNVSLFTGYKKSGELVTKPIPKPSGQIWDILSIDKTEKSTAVRIVTDIMDTFTNKPLQGYSNITGISADLSGINSTEHQYLKIKLRFYGDVIFTPVLGMLAISWQPPNGEVDNLLSLSKMAVTSNVELHDFTLTLSNGHDTGYFISRAIEIEPLHYWNVLFVDKVEPAENSYIGITLIDELSGKPIDDFMNLFDSEITLKALNPLRYKRIMLRVDFYGYSSKEPELNSIGLNWTKNRTPQIVELQGPSAIYRDSTETFSVFITDPDEPVQNLNISVFYSASSDDVSAVWETEFISSFYFKNGLWMIEFSPSKNAKIGTYDFKIIIRDFFQVTVEKDWPGIIEVLNHPPSAPSVIISPSRPFTIHDLSCFVQPPIDVNADDYKLIYRWYKNGILETDFVSDTIRSEFTRKYDTWRCEVTLFDGIDESQAGTQEVFIENSGPKVVSGDVVVTAFEDGVQEEGIRLDNYFSDDDNDRLNYTILPSDHLDISYDPKTSSIYVTPESDWYGLSDAVIFASDDSADISKVISINIQPLNDPPIISAVGNQILLSGINEPLKFNALEDQVLKLQVFARDIDGDKLEYSTNRTDGKGNDDISGISIDSESGIISFKPESGETTDVYLNISVSDNNGSKVFTEIKITVYEKNKSSFQQVLFSTNWMVLIVALIVIFTIYYVFIISKARFKAYLRRKYREKLTGTGRLYANYPMVVQGEMDMIPGRYPTDGGEYTPLVDPYRAALYSYKQSQTKLPVGPERKN